MNILGQPVGDGHSSPEQYPNTPSSSAGEQAEDENEPSRAFNLSFRFVFLVCSNISGWEFYPGSVQPRLSVLSWPCNDGWPDDGGMVQVGFAERKSMGCCYFDKQNQEQDIYLGRREGGRRRLYKDCIRPRLFPFSLPSIIPSIASKTIFIHQETKSHSPKPSSQCVLLLLSSSPVSGSPASLLPQRLLTRVPNIPSATLSSRE